MWPPKPTKGRTRPPGHPGTGRLAQALLGLAGTFADRHEKDVKLRASDGNMKGILPKLMQDFIRDQYGQAVYDGMRRTWPSHLPAHQNYPDQVLRQMAELAAAKAGKTPADVFLTLGRYSIKASTVITRAIQGGQPQGILLTMNDTHARLTKDMPACSRPSSL